MERLCHQAAKYNREFEEKVTVWPILDGFYIATRYPNGLPDSIPAKVYTKYAASQAVELAEAIVEFVKAKGKLGEFDQLWQK